MDALLRSERINLIAALGAGVVMGISGIYYYYKIKKCVTRELSHLSGTIDGLRKEIEELKTASVKSSSSKEKPFRCSSRKKVNISSSSAATKYYSYASSIDDPDEEYFDFTDTEDVVGTWASLNGSREDLSADEASDPFICELDALLDSSASDKESLHQKMYLRKDDYIDNAEFYWRFAKVTHLYGIVVQNQNDMEKRKDLAFEAYNYAKRAYELDQDNAEVYKWCAITVGTLGDFVSTQERIVNGFTFKDHVDKAISLKPADPSLHYMLGRWCYEVSMLSWIERRVASTLFSSPPDATLDEARKHLLEADKLKPDWKENLLFLAKTYIGDGDYSKAISVIDKAIDIPVISEDDDIAHKELEGLEYKFQTHRS